MTKPKIKFKLVKFERALVFQVLEMDERFRVKRGGQCFNIESSFTVCSVDTPGLYSDSIDLRGSDTKEDFHVSVEHFGSNEARDKRYNRALEALKNWADNWPGWNEPAQDQQPDEPDVFVF